MDTQTLDKTLHDCNYDIELTITKLHELSLASSKTKPIIQPQQQQQQQQQHDDQVNQSVLTEGDLKWVDLLVQEMSCATSIEDAKSRAAKAVAARVRDEAVTADELQERNTRLSQENYVYKRLVVMQYERLKKECEDKKREVERLNGMLSKCKEELNMSEFNNYTLRIHLNQASHIPSPSIFNRLPDVH